MLHFKIVLENGNTVLLDILAPDLFRLRLDSDGKFKAGGLERYSLLNLNWEKCKVEEQVSDVQYCFITEKAELRINRSDGNFQLFLKDGTELISTAAAPQGSQEKGFDLQLSLQADEKLYGLGDESRESLNKRGHANLMSVTNVVSYTPIPFFSSNKGWGLYLNSTWMHHFDGGKEQSDILRMHSDKGLLECFLFACGSIPETLKRYSELSGQSYVLPRWSYGLTFVCDEREVRARDVLYEAYEFRRQNIPCDVIGLEPSWMEKTYDFSTEKKWSEERFHIPFWLKGKNYGTFSSALHNMGFKLSLWLCCDYDLSEYEEMLLSDTKESTEDSETLSEAQRDSGSLADALIQDPRLFAAIHQDTQTKPGEAWFEHLKQFVDDGADAFKLDGANQVLYHPDRKWKNGMCDLEMHNLYPLLLAKQMCLGFHEYTGRRTQIFTPSGHAGIQKFSAIWAGDTGGGANTIAGLLNLSLSGVSNVCTDMEVHTKAGIHYGFLQPLAQAFSWHMYNQPWFLGTEKLELYRFYAQLRYSLLPYIYSMAHKARCTGMPMMRAMPLLYPELPESDKCLTQYMLGDSLLVGVFEEKIFLPPGKWYDFWTDELYEGNRWIDAKFPENRAGCLFVKAGSIIPRQIPGEFAGTESPEIIFWHFYPGDKDCSFTLYEDDGYSLKYMQGEIAETKVEAKKQQNEYHIKVNERKGQYENMPEIRKHAFKVHPENLQIIVPEKLQNKKAEAKIKL